HGLAPFGVGDWDLSPDAGKRSGDTRQPFQGLPDLVVTPPPDGLLRNDKGRFSGAPGASGGAGSVLLADLDNDFALDLYAARPEGDVILRNPNRPASAESSLAAKAGPHAPIPTPGKGPGIPLAVDLDMDGDLDIIRPSGAPDQPAIRYLRNNG